MLCYVTEIYKYIGILYACDSVWTPAPLSTVDFNQTPDSAAELEAFSIYRGS